MTSKKPAEKMVVADDLVRCQVMFGMGFEKGPIGQCALVIGHKGLHRLESDLD